MIAETYSFILSILILWCGILPVFWDWSLQIIELVGFSENNHVSKNNFITKEFSFI